MDVLTVCPYCGVGCGIYLRVREGRVDAVFPSLNHPVNRGSLCAKGWSVPFFLNHPQRARHPLIRKGNRFIRASWDEALDFVAEKLSEIKEKHGPDAIGVLGSAKCTNEDNYLIQKFARATIGTNNVDHCARLCHASTVAGLIKAFGAGAMTNSIEEFPEADVILITGSDTANQHPVIAKWIVRARKGGTKVMVVDPRRTPLARIADLYLQHRPGTDIAWINAFLKIIIEEELYDKKFIEERTENFEKLADSLRDFSLDWASGVTGIPLSLLREGTRLYAKAERASIVYAMGITQHVSGTYNVVSLANLALLTGNVGKRGTGVNPLRGQNNVQGASDLAVLPDVLPCYQKVDDPDVRKRYSELWGVEIPSNPGLTVTEMIHSSGEKIRAMYIMGENPLLSDPDINTVKRKLGELDLLVVQDIFFSETAELAHVFLPAASFAEKDGTFTNTERRVQRVRKAIEPPGEARADWRIIADLSNRLGYPMNYTHPCEILDEIQKVCGIYAGITCDILENSFGVRWPYDGKSKEGTSYLHGKRFKTKSGRGIFHAVDYLPPPEEPDETYPFIMTTGRSGFQWHTGTMTRRTPNLEREAPEAYVEINPKDADSLGIKDGDRVRVSSRRGEIELKARITGGIMPGVVFIPFHYKEAAANLLTGHFLDPISKIPELKVTAVRVEKC